MRKCLLRGKALRRVNNQQLCNQIFRLLQQALQRWRLMHKSLHTTPAKQVKRHACSEMLSQMGSSASYSPLRIFSKSTASMSSSAAGARMIAMLGRGTATIMLQHCKHLTRSTAVRMRTKGRVARQQNEQNDADAPHVHRQAVCLHVAVRHLQDFRRNILRSTE